MPYILFSEQEKQSANASDIRSFLASLGQEVKRSGREYTWESPSGKVSINGSEWYSQYERVGGGAVSFVQKFFGASYPDAVRSLLGSCAGQIPSEQSNTFRQSRSKETQTELVLPQKSTDMRRLYGYLLNERCLDRDVVYAFVHAGILYEDAPNHNAVFIGTDENGKPRHIQKRSTNPQSDYKGNITGSDIAYAFHHVGTSDRLYVFEAPIDMMAYISMNKPGWEQHSYTALCSTADCAAIRMLKTYPNLKTVYLCLDHDSAGIEGAYRVAESIHALGDYTVWRKMPKNKDWDEDLKALHGRTAIPSTEHTKLERYRKICAEFLADACMETDAWKHIAEAKGYAFANFLSLLRSEMGKAESATDTQTEQAHLRAMAVGCLAFCFCREKQMGSAPSFDRYADAVRSAYKPHRDTEGSDEQWESLRKRIKGLEKEFGKSIPLSETEMKKQLDSVIALASDCIRLSAAVEYEQSEQAAVLSLE